MSGNHLYAGRGADKKEKAFERRFEVSVMDESTKMVKAGVFTEDMKTRLAGNKQKLRDKAHKILDTILDDLIGKDS